MLKKMQHMCVYSALCRGSRVMSYLTVSMIMLFICPLLVRAGTLNGDEPVRPRVRETSSSTSGSRPVVRQHRASGEERRDDEALSPAKRFAQACEGEIVPLMLVGLAAASSADVLPQQGRPLSEASDIGLDLELILLGRTHALLSRLSNRCSDELAEEREAIEQDLKTNEEEQERMRYEQARRRQIREETE